MQFRYLQTDSEVLALIERLNAECGYVVLDTETTGLDPFKDSLVDIQLSGVRPEEAFAFPAQFAPLLKSLRPQLVGHNLKFDFKMLYRAGVDLTHLPWRDTMLMHHLIDENAAHDLDSLVKERWNDDFKERFWGRFKVYTEADSASRLDYSCRDIVYTNRLFTEFGASLRDLRFLVDHIHSLARTLLATELRGIPIDLPFLMETGTQLKSDIVTTEAGLRQIAGTHCDIIEHDLWAEAIRKAWTPKGKKWRTVEKPEFNFRSSSQVATLLYEGLKLPVQKHPKTKKPTADDGALDALESAHPLIPELRKLRKYSKMYGAFVEGVLDRMHDGRIYPSFNVNGTTTGRISHSDPNMGQMPSKGEWSKIRGIFVPEPGNKLVTCDYSQLEVCIAAHFSLDKNLLKIIHEGASKHDITAEALGVPRSTAKTLNFALQYQCSPRKVAQIIGCSLQDGEYYWNKYWETYSGEKAVIDDCKAKVDRGEPIVNPFGRHRRFPTTFEAPWMREAAYRQAYSSLIQGTGSEFTSYSLYTLGDWLIERGFGRAWFTIHDEILEEIREVHVEEVRAKTVEVMVGAGRLANLRVPLAVECSLGLDRWQK